MTYIPSAWPHWPTDPHRYVLQYTYNSDSILLNFYIAHLLSCLVFTSSIREFRHIPFFSFPKKYIHDFVDASFYSIHNWQKKIRRRPLAAFEIFAERLLYTPPFGIWVARFHRLVGFLNCSARSCIKKESNEMRCDEWGSKSSDMYTYLTTFKAAFRPIRQRDQQELTGGARSIIRGGQTPNKSYLSYISSPFSLFPFPTFTIRRPYPCPFNLDWPIVRIRLYVLSTWNGKTTALTEWHTYGLRFFDRSRDQPSF